MRVWVAITAATLVLGSAPQPASADSSRAVDLTKEAPKTTFSAPTAAAVKLTPALVIPDNVRAAAIIYAVSRYEKAGLLAAGSRIASDYEQQKLKLSGPALASVKRLAGLEGAQGPDRLELITFVADLIREQFAAIVDSSQKQLDAYQDLVSSVASSVDQFASDNVTAGQGRDSLTNELLVFSNAGYGAAHYAAARLSQQAHESSQLVQRSEIQKAYAVKSASELIAKLSGRPRATVDQEIARGDLGAALVLWALRHGTNVKGRKAQARKDGVAALIERFKKLGAYHPRAIKRAPTPPRPRPSCLRPGGAKLVPCAAK